MRWSPVLGYRGRIALRSLTARLHTHLLAAMNLLVQPRDATQGGLMLHNVSRSGRHSSPQHGAPPHTLARRRKRPCAIPCWTTQFRTAPQLRAARRDSTFTQLLPYISLCGRSTQHTHNLFRAARHNSAPARHGATPPRSPPYTYM